MKLLKFCAFALTVLLLMSALPHGVALPDGISQIAAEGLARAGDLAQSFLNGFAEWTNDLVKDLLSRFING